MTNVGRRKIRIVTIAALMTVIVIATVDRLNRANRIALGGMSSVQRLQTIREYSATTLVCTPSYAVRLANALAESGQGDGRTLEDGTHGFPFTCRRTQGWARDDAARAAAQP